LHYRPSSLLSGAAISGLALVIGLGLIVITRRRQNVGVSS
jgi:LPXTG-motif cell wall-anchored protein